MFEELRAWLAANPWRRSVSITCTAHGWRVGLFEARLNTCTEVAVGRAKTIAVAEQQAMHALRRDNREPEPVGEGEQP